MKTVSSHELGKAERLEDGPGRYIEFCKSTIPFGMHLRGLKVVVDCAHGAAYHVAPNVFDELGAEVSTIGAEPNGLNINDRCGATAPEALQAAVLAATADVGIALDGDGDRVVMVDHQGEVVDGDEILLVIARSRKASERLTNRAVVGTIMSNLGLEEALGRDGLELKRASVGDRYVLELMREGGCTLGGETSGHIICLDKMTTGDGIVAALQVLAEMRRSAKSLSELKQGMVKHPQVMVNVPLPDRQDVIQLPAVRAAVVAAESELGDGGRVLLRPSGTEPIVRVMVEGRDRQQVESLAYQLADAVQEALA